MSDATLVEEDGRPAVRLERRLSDPPATVWRAITDREELRSWFPCDVFVTGGQWVVGASITFAFPPDVIDLTLTGEVLAVDVPRLLVYTWGEETLRFELSDDDGGTRLVLVDELSPGAAARNAAGWEDCLDRLVGVEPGAGAWKLRFDAYAAAFESALGPQEGPPAAYKGEKSERPA
jgi:uncharacterized protein YndB with AHSA1/START domain